MFRRIAFAVFLVASSTLTAAGINDFKIRSVGIGSAKDEAAKAAAASDREESASVPGAGIEVFQFSYKDGFPRKMRVTFLDGAVAALNAEYAADELAMIGSAQDLYDRLLDKLGQPSRLDRPQVEVDNKRVESVAQWVSGERVVSLTSVSGADGPSASIAVVDLKRMQDVADRRKKNVSVGF